MIEFGLGLIGIGKPWGYANAIVPDERQARALLERAFELGVRYYDTAPSYGVSEARFSGFLASLSAAERTSLRVATKFGEHWDAAREQPFVDHSFDALRRSLEGSLERLGRIDVLQLHKTTPQVLRSEDLGRAWAYAASLGIAEIGASVSDLESSQIVLADSRYRVIQLPYNCESLRFEAVIEAARARDLKVVVNRPFGMGRMLYERTALTKAEAFGFILKKRFNGVILSGTKSPAHLQENWEAFQKTVRLQQPR